LVKAKKHERQTVRLGTLNGVYDALRLLDSATEQEFANHLAARFGDVQPVRSAGDSHIRIHPACSLVELNRHGYTS
jgi:hypothetical protein